MRVRVDVNEDGIKVNETFEGANSEEIVGKMKARVAKEMPFALKIAVNAMGTTMFAQEVVKRYNTAKKQNLPLPNTCDEFLQQAQVLGVATIEQA